MVRDLFCMWKKWLVKLRRLGLWVMMIRVLLVLWVSCLSSVIIWVLVLVFRLLVGLLVRIREGLWDRVCVIVICCCLLLESMFGKFVV